MVVYDMHMCAHIHTALSRCSDWVCTSMCLLCVLLLLLLLGACTVMLCLCRCEGVLDTGVAVCCLMPASPPCHHRRPEPPSASAQHTLEVFLRTHFEIQTEGVVVYQFLRLCEAWRAPTLSTCMHV